MRSKAKTNQRARTTWNSYNQCLQYRIDYGVKPFLAVFFQAEIAAAVRWDREVKKSWGKTTTWKNHDDITKIYL